MAMPFRSLSRLPAVAGVVLASALSTLAGSLPVASAGTSVVANSSADVVVVPMGVAVHYPLHPPCMSE
jgi:hypothetical protein